MEDTMAILYYGSKTLLHQGLDSIDNSIKSVLEKARADYLIYENEKPCAEGLYPLGFEDEAKKEAELFIRDVKKFDVEMIITPYAAPLYTWKKSYPEEFGLNLPVNIEHITNFLYDRLRNENIHFKKMNVRVGFHDGCTLGRKLGVYEEPRNLLKMIPGLKILNVEHPQISFEGTNVSDWGSCSGAWLNMTIPELAEWVEENVIREDFLPLRPDIITSTCANALFGIMQGIKKGNYPFKSMFITEIIDEAWEEK